MQFLSYRSKCGASSGAGYPFCPKYPEKTLYFFVILQSSNISKNQRNNRNCGNRQVLYTFTCKRGIESRAPPD